MVIGYKKGTIIGIIILAILVFICMFAYFRMVLAPFGLRQALIIG